MRFWFKRRKKDVERGVKFRLPSLLPPVCRAEMAMRWCLTTTQFETWADRSHSTTRQSV
jgi:hypothetical protein